MESVTFQSIVISIHHHPALGFALVTIKVVVIFVDGIEIKVKQELSVTVRGKQHEWNFHFDGDPKYLAEWREDGLTVNEVVNSIPDWIAGTILMRPWIFIQDIFRFRNPFQKAGSK